jgi:hypothetical protein
MRNFFKKLNTENSAGRWPLAAGRWPLAAGGLVLAALNACGGGGGGGTDNGTGSAAAPIAGRVADGYINGAIIFWDCNGNSNVEPHEIQVKSGVGGMFSIAPAPQSSCVLTAKIPLGAIDEDTPTQPVDRPYTLVSTKGNENFISPLSTLVAAHLAQNPLASISDAQSAVASSLGIVGNLNSDYIAEQTGDSIIRRGVSKIAATILQKNNLPNNVLAGISSGYTEIQSLAPSIKTVDFSSPVAISSFINPFRGFLKLSPYTAFSKNDSYTARPNSKLNLTESQLTLLDSIISTANLNDAIRNGVLNFNELSFAELVSLRNSLEQASLIQLASNSNVVNIRKLRDADQAVLATYQKNNLETKRKYFTSDIAANLQFWTQVSISSVEAVSGAVSTYTGLPSTDLRSFKSLPKLKGVVKTIKTYKIGEVIKAILKGVKSSGKVLTATQEAAILSLGSANSDGTILTTDQFDALAELLGTVVEVGKGMVKNDDFGLTGELFGPALALYSASGDCADFSSAECFTDGLQILESVAEWAHLGSRTQGALLWLRTTVDAYVAGKEYALVNDTQVSAAQSEVMDDWNARTKQKSLYWLLQEIGVAGIDNLFEAYDPTIACAANAQRRHGACISMAPTAFQVNPISFQQINSGQVMGDSVFYSSGLVLYMPTSTAYDNATVQGIGTESQPNGVVVLQDIGGPSLQILRSDGVAKGEVLLLGNISAGYIPKGTNYTIKLYKGTALVSTQTVSLASAVIAPADLPAFAAAFPVIGLRSYAALCPNDVAITSTGWYTIPNSSPKSPKASISCPFGMYGQAVVEYGDANNYRFLSNVYAPKTTAPIAPTYVSEITPIATQTTYGSVAGPNTSTSYETGLVINVVKSPTGAYDNATVFGLGTAGVGTGGVVKLEGTSYTRDGTISPYFQLVGFMGAMAYNILPLPASLPSVDLPAGSQYAVKFYKGTTFVSSQVISTTAGALGSLEMTPYMFPNLTLNTYAQLCPNDVATQSSFYALPSTLVQTLFAKVSRCGLISGMPGLPPEAAPDIEATDVFKRRFRALFYVSGP